MARFSNAVELLKELGPSSLTDIAFQAGYYDQPHFNSDVKAFTSRNPSGLVLC